MNRYTYLDSKKGQVILTLFLAAQLFLSRDTLLSSCVLGFTKSQVLMVLLTALLGAGFLLKNRTRLGQILTDRRMLAALIAVGALLLPCVLKRDWQLMYVSMLFCLLFAILLSFFTTVQEAAKLYVVILAGLSLYSLLATYVLRLLPDGGYMSVPVFYNSRDVKFYNFFLSYVSETYVKNRNFGIFREPGVHQYFLLLGLLLNHYQVSWSRKGTKWCFDGIFAVTMLTTLATGGYLELALFALVVFLDEKLYRDKRAWIALGGLALIGGGAFAVCYAHRSNPNSLYWELYGMTVSKFLPGEESGSDRLQSILTNLKLFLGSPLWGADVAQVLHAIENNTSSTTILYAILGVFGGSLNAAGWVALVWSRERKILGNLLLLLAVFLSFNTQNLTANVFFWLMPTMALIQWWLQRNGKGASRNGENAAA